MKACLFVNNLNHDTHGEYKRSLANAFGDGMDHYPGDVGEALSRAVNYLKIRPERKPPQPPSDGMSFLQQKGRKGKGGNNNANDNSEVVCYACGGTGHYADECEIKKEMIALRIDKEKKDRAKTGDSHATTASTISTKSSGRPPKEEELYEWEEEEDGDEEHSLHITLWNDVKDAHAFVQHIFHQDTSNDAMRNWLLLDSGSTLSVICNEELLEGIHKVNEAIRVRCNAGKKIVNEKGFLPLFQEDVWFA